MKSTKNTFLLAYVISILICTSCNENWLDEQPRDRLSEAVFWETEEDATRALIGVYKFGIEQNIHGLDNTIWQTEVMTDNAIHKSGRDERARFVTPEFSFITGQWRDLYRAINKANIFLANIGNVEMDPDKKEEYIGEVRFIRAYSYFWLSQWWGDVPLITTPINAQEANSVSRDDKQLIIDFCLNEFTSAADALPSVRPISQKGRILKAAPFAYKGRLLMAEKRWTEAAATYKEIIDLGVHKIDPRFKELFEESGESSNEIIFSMERVAGIAGQNRNHVWYFDQIFGGYSVVNYYQGLVDAFLMNDGLPIEKSPSYDSLHPFDNRDPRLYMSILLPEFSTWEGTLYSPHPDSANDLGVRSGAGRTGYGPKKFTAEYYEGDVNSSGADLIYVRYAEVLLSYLESKLEAGDVITQDLLDESINEVRGRGSVGMPPVTETNPDLLRSIVRRERRVELLGEPGIRYWDLIRWRIAHEVLNGELYGMKVTNDPVNYTEYNVNSDGHLIIIDLNSFDEDINYLFPIPLSEIDINSNLKQNPGYSSE